VRFLKAAAPVPHHLTSSHGLAEFSAPGLPRQGFLGRSKCEKCLILLARSEGFEPPAPRFVVWCFQLGRCLALFQLIHDLFDAGNHCDDPLPHLIDLRAIELEVVAISATPTNSDGASATAKTRRSKGSKSDTDWSASGRKVASCLSSSDGRHCNGRWQVVLYLWRGCVGTRKARQVEGRRSSPIWRLTLKHDRLDQTIR
jgi:hypothetical protein